MASSMSVYEGPATVVTSNRTEVDVTVKLHVKAESVRVGEEDIPLRSWRGEGYAQPSHWDHALLGPATLRLPDGREGAIAITEDRFTRGATTVTLLFAGQGPYPAPLE